jgi:hypothetical protein
VANQTIRGDLRRGVPQNHTILHTNTDDGSLSNRTSRLRQHDLVYKTHLESPTLVGMQSSFKVIDSLRIVQPMYECGVSSTPLVVKSRICVFIFIPAQNATHLRLCISLVSWQTKKLARNAPAAGSTDSAGRALTVQPCADCIKNSWYAVLKKLEACRAAQAMMIAAGDLQRVKTVSVIWPLPSRSTKPVIVNALIRTRVSDVCHLSTHVGEGNFTIREICWSRTSPARRASLMNRYPPLS